MSKLTLQLSPEMDEVLEELAEERDVSKAQVLRQAMLLLRYLDGEVADAKDIIVRDRETGEASVLVFEGHLGSHTAKGRKQRAASSKANTDQVSANS